MEIHRDDPPEHLGADLEELLAEDPRVNEQGLHVTVGDGAAVVRGAVATEARRDAIGQVLAEQLPGWRVDNQVEVLAADLAAPARAERLGPDS